METSPTPLLLLVLPRPPAPPAQLVLVLWLLWLLCLLSDVTWMDPKVFASTILVCTIVWTVVEVWLFGKTKVLYVDPAQGSAGPPHSGGVK